MYLATDGDDINKSLKIINDFYNQATKEYLNDKEQSILQGSLENLTYQNMQQKYRNLRYYTLQYISRNLAYDLWRKLTIAARKSPFFEDNYQVKKRKIWQMIDRLNQLQGESNIQPINIPAATMEGEIIGERYKIEEYLFDCEAGERQFVALDRYLDNKPCLVIQRVQQTARVKQQFEREGKSLSLIGKHPQIPELLAYFRQQQHLYLVYEYVSGTALTELLTGKPWQEDRVKSLLCSLLTVLEFIQQHNLTHRNINPDNIIKVGNQWMLIDFATVKEINRDNEYISRSTLSRGTKGYLAPEQHTGMSTFKSDLYSVGMIAIHALTGIHPRKLRRYDPQTGNKIWRDLGKTEALRDRVSVSNHLAEVIDRATWYHFSDRYESATQMLDSLKLAVV